VQFLPSLPVETADAKLHTLPDPYVLPRTA
jgi:hypothetical protein